MRQNGPTAHTIKRFAKLEGLHFTVLSLKKTLGLSNPKMARNFARAHAGDYFERIGTAKSGYAIYQLNASALRLVDGLEGEKVKRTEALIPEEAEMAMVVALGRAIMGQAANNTSSRAEIIATAAKGTAFSGRKLAVILDKYCFPREDALWKFEVTARGRYVYCMLDDRHASYPTAPTTPAVPVTPVLLDTAHEAVSAAEVAFCEAILEVTRDIKVLQQILTCYNASNHYKK